jgi:sugar phosphate permease
VLAAGTFAQSTYSAIWFGVAVLAPALRDEYDLSLAQTGVLISASLLGSVLTLVPWGMAADRFGERAVLVVGIGLCGGALLLATQAHSFWALFACLFATGLAGASVHSSSGRAVMSWFPARQRGLALGIRQTAIPIGGFAVSLFIPPIEHAFGIPWAFGALGAACLAAAVIGGLVLREGAPDDDAVHIGPAPLRDTRVWSLAAGSALVVAPQMCVVGFAVLFLHDRRGLSPGAAAGVLAAIQLCGIGARIGAGRWSDVAGDRIAPLRAIALASAVLTFVTALLVGAPLWLLVPSLVATGVFAMSWNGLAFAAATEIAGRARSGAAIGLQQTVLNAVGAAYPPLFGVLVAATSWGWGFASIALLPLAGRHVLRALRA